MAKNTVELNVKDSNGKVHTFHISNTVTKEEDQIPGVQYGEDNRPYLKPDGKAQLKKRSTGGKSSELCLRHFGKGNVTQTAEYKAATPPVANASPETTKRSEVQMSGERQVKLVEAFDLFQTAMIDCGNNPGDALKFAFANKLKFEVRHLLNTYAMDICREAYQAAYGKEMSKEDYKLWTGKDGGEYCPPFTKVFGEVVKEAASIDEPEEDFDEPEESLLPVYVGKSGKPFVRINGKSVWLSSLDDTSGYDVDNPTTL